MFSTKKAKFFRFHELMCWWPTRRPEDLRLFDLDEFFRVTTDVLKLSKLGFDAPGTKQDQITWKAGAAFSYVHTMWNVPLACPERYLVLESFVSQHLQECLSCGTFPLSTTLIYEGDEAREKVIDCLWAATIRFSRSDTRLALRQLILMEYLEDEVLVLEERRLSPWPQRWFSSHYTVRSVRAILRKDVCRVEWTESEVKVTAFLNTIQIDRHSINRTSNKNAPEGSSPIPPGPYSYRNREWQQCFTCRNPELTDPAVCAICGTTAA